MSDPSVKDRRRLVLEGLGGSAGAVAQVLDYGRNRFERSRLPAGRLLPQPDEPHLADWRAYVERRGDQEPFEFLQSRLAHLNIPITEGVSASDAYRDVIRRGRPFHADNFGGRLTLEEPDAFSFFIHENATGALPVLRSDHRPDFETIVQALVYRCEPRAVNHSVSAHLVSGLINWNRVGAYRAGWRASAAPAAQALGWGKEMQRVAKQESWRFHDRIMIVGGSPYSGLLAEELNLVLSEPEWLERSLAWRLEHEFTHYLTQRLYGISSLNLLDETICDFAGIQVGLGAYDHVCYLRMLGLERFPHSIRASGRVHAYRGDLDDEAFHLECAVVVAAARNLEALAPAPLPESERVVFLLALTRLTLEQLASESYEDEFAAAQGEAAEILAERAEQTS